MQRVSLRFAELASWQVSDRHFCKGSIDEFAGMKDTDGDFLRSVFCVL
jgi:hypothetical protein